jgi:hypothetical protein
MNLAYWYEESGCSNSRACAGEPGRGLGAKCRGALFLKRCCPRFRQQRAATRRAFSQETALTFWNLSLRTALIAGCAIFPFMLHAQVTATATPVSGVQEGQRFDVEGGAAYSHFNPGYAHQVAATNLIGWDGSITGWFSNLLGLEATERGVYGTYKIPAYTYNGNGPTAVLPANSSLSENLFLFGPSFRLYQSEKYTGGMHLLFGGTYGSFDSGFAGTGVQPFQVGVYNNQLASAYAIGGWGDYKLRPKFAIRFTADYQPTRYSAVGQNEFFGSIGIVYKFGRRK